MPAAHETRHATASSLCSLGERPRLLKGAIRQVLIAHFSDPANIEAPQLRGLVWSDGDDSPIAIETADRWAPGKVERRPALLVGRTPVRAVKRGIANRMQGTVAPDGFERYAVLWAGTILVAAVAGESGEAEVLAEEASRVVGGFSQVIRDDLLLHQFDPGDFGEVRRLNESSENFAVTLSYLAAFEESWTLRSNAPALREVRLDARPVAADPIRAN
jgi:hypothetical protein